MPRVAIELEVEEHSALKAYAAHARRPMGALVKEAIASMLKRPTRGGPLTAQEKARALETKRVMRLCEKRSPAIFRQGEVFDVKQFIARLRKSSTAETAPTTAEVALIDDRAAYRLLHARSGSGRVFEPHGEARYSVRASAYATPVDDDGRRLARKKGA